jgi:glycosyltransferase involved in cell wall biosynthesis
MMKIIKIADVMNNRTGGMSRTMYCTGDHMIQSGHVVDYIFKEDFTTAAIGTLRTLAVSFEILKMIRQRMKEGIYYDVIEIHEPIAAAYCFAKQFDKSLPPVVLFSYGIERRSQEVELSYHRQKNLPISLALRSIRVTVLLSNYALKHCDRIICSNSEDIQFLVANGISSTKIALHQSGIDQEFLDVSSHEIDAHLNNTVEKDVKILFLGSWIIRKGILDIVEAMKTLLQRFPDIQFTVAGCNCSQEVILSNFPDSLQQQIKIIPKIDGNHELIEIYRNHSILLLPSFFEGQPLVLMEASAIGLVTVTTEICGMKDFIEPNKNGLVVSVGNPETIIDNLSTLILNPKFRVDLGKMAKQKVQSYTWENAARNIEKSYRLAINT